MAAAQKISGALLALLLTLATLFGAGAVLPVAAAQELHAQVKSVEQQELEVTAKAVGLDAQRYPQGFVFSVQPADEADSAKSAGAAFVPANQADAAVTVFAAGAKLTPKAAYEVVVYPANSAGAVNPGTAVLVKTPLTISAADWDALAQSETAAAVGVLSWGVKKSFLNYIRGPIAHGTATAVAPASGDGVFNFPQTTGGTYSASSSTGTVNYAGAIKFTGHAGAIDFGIYNPQIRINSDRQALLLVPGANGKYFELVNIDLGTATKTVNADGSVTYKGAETRLHQNGLAMFEAKIPGQAPSAFYRTGELFDPITFTIGATGSQSAVTLPSNTINNGAGGVPMAPAPQPADSAAQRAAVQQRVNQAEAGSFTWGISTAFARYVSEGYVAGRSTPVNTKGRVTGNGVAGGIGGFIFPQSGGNFNSATETGTINYSGVINFYAHGGLLNQSVANPSITVVNPERAELYVAGVHWGSIDLRGASKTKTPAGAVTWQGAVFIPGAGARQFLSSSYDSSGRIGFDTAISFTAGSANAAAGGSIVAAGNSNKSDESESGERKSATQVDALAADFPEQLSDNDSAELNLEAANAAVSSTGAPQLSWMWWLGAGVLSVVAAILAVAAWKQRK